MPFYCQQKSPVQAVKTSVTATVTAPYQRGFSVQAVAKERQPPASQSAGGHHFSKYAIEAPGTPASVSSRPRRENGQQPVQAFWLRQGPAVSWIDDTLNVDGALEESKQTQTEKYLYSKKANKYKTRQISVTETRGSYFGLGAASTVYRLRNYITIPWAQVQRLITTFGIDKTRRIFANNDSVAATQQGVDQLIRHSASLLRLDNAVFNTLVAQPDQDVRQFLTVLDPAKFMTYFQGSVPQQTALVTGRELRAFGSLVRSESEVTLARVLETDPTAAQGAHYHKEHGAHNTVHQTIKLAVEYALRGGAQATKGNWASNFLASRAIEWAQNKLDLDVQRARAHHARDTTVLDVITPPGGGAPSIFGGVRAKTRHAITDGPYHTGNVTGKQGNARARVTGDFVDKAGTNRPGVVRGEFTGTVTGALVPGTNIANQPVTIDGLRGNGAVTATLTGAAVAGNQLNGTIRGNIHYTGSQVGMTVGADRFNGIGEMHSMMDGNVVAASTNWALRPAPRVGGYIDAVSGRQFINDGLGNQGSLKSAEFTQGYWRNPVGKPVTAALTGYSNGWAHGVASGGQYANVNVSIDNTAVAPGGAFQPDTLRDIVNNADLAGKYNTYVKRAGGGGPPEIKGQLLSESPEIEGTLLDLQTANLVPNSVTSLASMRLQVTNVVKNNATLHPDVATVPAPVVGNNYSLLIEGNRYEFQLAALNLASAGWNEANFRVLFKRDPGANATYRPFTAY